MGAIIEQLQINETIFVQFVLFAVFFAVVANVYFRPFLKLIQERHKRTVQDSNAAEKLMAQAEAKLEEYQDLLTDARLDARREYDVMLAKAREEQTEVIAQARDEVKKINQEASAAALKQKEQLKKELEGEVERMATKATERLLQGKV